MLGVIAATPQRDLQNENCAMRLHAHVHKHGTSKGRHCRLRSATTLLSQPYNTVASTGCNDTEKSKSLVRTQKNIMPHLARHGIPNKACDQRNVRLVILHPLQFRAILFISNSMQRARIFKGCRCLSMTGTRDQPRYHYFSRVKTCIPRAPYGGRGADKGVTKVRQCNRTRPARIMGRV